MDAFDFTVLLHTYLKVEDIAEVEIGDLTDVEYGDKVNEIQVFPFFNDLFNIFVFLKDLRRSHRNRDEQWHPDRPRDRQVLS